MKKLVIHATSFNTFWAHYNVNKDKDFIDKLDSLGYQLYQSDEIDLNEADILLFNEATSVGLHRFNLYNKCKHLARLFLGKVPLNNHDVYNKCVQNDLIKKTAICIAEGIVHMPENHVSKLARLFPVVFTWNDTMVDNIHFFKYCIPQPVRWPEFERIPFNKKKLLVNISGNKYASHPDELYSTRRLAIKYFEKHFKDQFELYGIGWNKPATKQQNLKNNFPVYQSYKGMTVGKTEVFPKFRFAICYENHQCPGYITEKIFDCMRSDCVPIYLGAQNINDYLPIDSFIDRRNFLNDEQLASFILNIDEQTYEQYREAIRKYLLSDLFNRFLCTSYASTLVSVIENHLA